ncbi:hypothetical protein PUN28_017981 [Cardiocondyla obscurior]|uniref:Uncharacterized protein n=1 Tax=Cardiocondyla obscurior TaxID=286306 RepID=A0AAW2EJ60_9HYME
MNTTQEQKEILLEWMKQHPDVIRGRLCRKKSNMQTATEKLLNFQERKLKLKKDKFAV